jgi:arginine-tRNA-protein transferase
VEWARSEGLDHLYLGYWIEGHRKMDYKQRYRPLETFTGRGWRRLERGDDA